MEKHGADCWSAVQTEPPRTRIGSILPRAGRVLRVLLLALALFAGAAAAPANAAALSGPPPAAMQAPAAAAMQAPAAAAMAPLPAFPAFGLDGDHFWVKINRQDMTAGMFAIITAGCTAAFNLPGLFVCGSIGLFVRSTMARNPWAHGVWVEVRLSGLRGGTW